MNELHICEECVSHTHFASIVLIKNNQGYKLQSRVVEKKKSIKMHLQQEEKQRNSFLRA